MLTHLKIINYAIVESLQLDFQSGLTVITGETGAGKSIIIDALAFVLGERADASMIRHQQEKCEITAHFDIEKIPLAQLWLKENDIECNEEECLIRRVLFKDGRSRASINGSSCTLQQMKEFSNYLVNIHSQNQHQLLAKKNYQRDLLDAFANHSELNRIVFNLCQQWRDSQKKLEKLLGKTQFQSQMELLKYQLEELQALSLYEHEYEHLDIEHKQLTNADKHIQICELAMDLLSENEQFNVISALYQAQNQLAGFSENERIRSVLDLIQNALVQIEEAANELRDTLQKIEVNPQRFHIVEKRLEKIHEIARKHQVNSTDLFKVQQQLDDKVQHLTTDEHEITSLKLKMQELFIQYQKAAADLSDRRQIVAKKLATVITEKIRCLGMPLAEFEIQLQSIQDAEPQPYGYDHIEFFVTTNPGQPLQSVGKVASGGELSRIALAIYVVTAQSKNTPLLIFDEVDVGIGGGIAAIVGQLLRSLGEIAQIICITHLPQVASQGHQHIKIDKRVQANETQTAVDYLTAAQRINEIARMLGGVTVTKTTLAHAKEMLAVVSS